MSNCPTSVVVSGDACRQPDGGGVRPGDGHELVPPAGHHQADVEAQDEGQWDEVGEAAAVHGKLLEGGPT